jgi:integrase
LALWRKSQTGPLSSFTTRKLKTPLKAYQSDWTHFEGWCKAHGQVSLPATAETFAFYLTDLSTTHKTSTLIRRVSAISQAHQIAGFDTPTKSSQVRLVLAGIRRTKGTAQVAKTPVLVEDLRRMVSKLPENLLGTRDRALLLVGFSGAFRRSELVAVDVADAAITRDGVVVIIRRSKTDQEGEGRKIGIPYGSNPATCPVKALQDWLQQCRFTEGPLFRPIDRFSRVGVNSPVRCCRRRNREEICGGVWFGRHQVRRSQFAVGAGYFGCDGRSFGAVDYESNRPPVGEYGTPVHPGW